MQAVALTGIKEMELIDLPEPKIEKPTDVLLKLESIGVCGSDVHYYETGRIGSQVVEFPFIVGHECSARVVETGKDVKRTKVGQLVAIDPAMVCHKCDQCLAGRENTCRNLRFLGCPGQAEGCLKEFMIMPEDSLYPVDDSKLTSEQVALIEPLTIGLYAVKQAGNIENKTVAILGAGPIGLSVLLCAKALNCGKVFITDLLDYRIESAKTSGHADYIGNPEKTDIVKDFLSIEPLGMDIVFECAGKQETLDQAVELLKPGGKLLIIGIPRAERVSFVIDRIRRKEITIINVRRQNKCVQATIDLMSDGRVNADFMITHRFTLRETKQAFDLVSNYEDNVIKAMINL